MFKIENQKKWLPKSCLIASAFALFLAPSQGFSDSQTKITVHNLPMSSDLPGTYGSDLTYDPTDRSYWMITDRGPLVNGLPNPSFNLRLVHLKVNPGRANIQEIIPITDNGVQMTGVDIDPEGISVAPDGTLWACDEQYPILFHMNRMGEILERITPPAKYQTRVSNQGFEGITVSADGETVYSILQSGLSTEPDKQNTLLLAYHIPSKTFKEYKYRLDGKTEAETPYPAGVSPKFGSNCLATIDNSTILVCERDNQAADNSRIKRIYKVSIPVVPTTAPLGKELFLDLKHLNYPFEKLEGLALTNNPNHIVVANDNDGDLSIPTQLWYIKIRR